MIICGVIFDVDKKDSKVKELQNQTSQPSFWNDQIAAQKTLQEIKSLESWVNLWKEVQDKYQNLEEIIQLAKMENDSSFEGEIQKELDELKEAIENAELKNMLSGKVHPGLKSSSGSEAP